MFLDKYSGITNVVAVGNKTIVTPDKTPGIDKGNIILENTCFGLAPKSRADSIYDLSIFINVVYIGIIINGKYTYTIPIIAAKSYAKKSIASIPNHPNILFNGPCISNI
ncbi:hypothetical protein SDC9_210188 [bioreactor metagenome]|uniref:Uncharacterized protein n=1 Tax=bioreactor metagenome TaxID=1076179 RepID=A0A645JH54_9ZZZZ